MHILVDSGPLIALFDGSDQYHHRAVECLRALRRQLLTNAVVVTEVCHLLEFGGGRPRLDFLEWVEQAVDLDGPTREDLPRAREVLAKYADLPADFTDASLVRLAERRGVRDILTVDRDFEVYRTLSLRVAASACNPYRGAVSGRGFGSTRAGSGRGAGGGGLDRAARVAGRLRTPSACGAA